MPKAVAQEQPLYYFQEDGSWYHWTLQSVEEVTREWTVKEHHQDYIKGRAQLGDKKSFKRWEWKFVAADGPYKGDEIKIETDEKLSTNRDNDVMRAMVEAFIGGPLVEGQEIDTDLYEGLNIQATIKNLPARTSGDRTYYNSTFGECAPAGEVQNSVETSTFADEPPF